MTVLTIYTKAINRTARNDDRTAENAYMDIDSLIETGKHAW